MGSTTDQEFTTVRVKTTTHSRLDELKPYDSITFDELLIEMADVYEREKR